MNNKYDIIYTRQSIYKENSISQLTQREFCEEHLKREYKDDLKLLVLDEDKNKSGGTLDRPKLDKLRKLVKSGQVRSVTVYKLDRISRSLIQFAELMDEFEKNDITFYATDMKVDIKTPLGKAFLEILMIFAQLERENIIMRVSDAYYNRSIKGFYMGGRRPYGFNLEDYNIEGKNTKRFIINEAEMRQVEELFSTYSIDSFSLRTVLKHMLEHDMQDLSGAGWSTAKISNILKSPLYVKADEKIYDYYKSKNIEFADGLTLEMFDGTHALQVYGRTKHDETKSDFSDMMLVMLPTEGKIDSETWLKCQKKLDANNQIGNAVSNKVTWLGGKVFCKECGHRMTTIKGKPTKDGTITTYFNCIGRSDKRKCKGPATVYISELETVIAKAITLKLKTLKTERRVLSKENETLIADINRQIGEIKSKEDKIFERILDGEFNDYVKAKAEENLSELGKKKEELKQQIDDIMAKDDILTQSIDLAEKWRKAGFQTRKTVLDALVDSILIHKDGQPEIIWKI